MMITVSLGEGLRISLLVNDDGTIQDLYEEMKKQSPSFNTDFYLIFEGEILEQQENKPLSHFNFNVNTILEYISVEQFDNIKVNHKRHCTMNLNKVFPYDFDSTTSSTNENDGLTNDQRINQFRNSFPLINPEAAVDDVREETFRKVKSIYNDFISQLRSLNRFSSFNLSEEFNLKTFKASNPNLESIVSCEWDNKYIAEYFEMLNCTLKQMDDLKLLVCYFTNLIQKYQDKIQAGELELSTTIYLSMLSAEVNRSLFLLSQLMQSLSEYKITYPEKQHDQTNSSLSAAKYTLEDSLVSLQKLYEQLDYYKNFQKYLSNSQYPIVIGSRIPQTWGISESAEDINRRFQNVFQSNFPNQRINTNHQPGSISVQYNRNLEGVEYSLNIINPPEVRVVNVQPQIQPNVPPAVTHNTQRIISIPPRSDIINDNFPSEMLGVIERDNSRIHEIISSNLIPREKLSYGQLLGYNEETADKIMSAREGLISGVHHFISSDSRMNKTYKKSVKDKEGFMELLKSKEFIDLTKNHIKNKIKKRLNEFSYNSTNNDVDVD